MDGLSNSSGVPGVPGEEIFQKMRTETCPSSVQKWHLNGCLTLAPYFALDLKLQDAMKPASQGSGILNLQNDNEPSGCLRFDLVGRDVSLAIFHDGARHRFRRVCHDQFHAA